MGHSHSRKTIRGKTPSNFQCCACGGMFERLEVRYDLENNQYICAACVEETANTDQQSSEHQ